MRSHSHAHQVHSVRSIDDGGCGARGWLQEWLDEKNFRGGLEQEGTSRVGAAGTGAGVRSVVHGGVASMQARSKL